MSGLKIQEHVNAEPLCTLAIPSMLRYFVAIASLTELKAAVAFARREGVRPFPLGDGSNIVFGADTLDIAAIKNTRTGIRVLDETDTHTDITIQAGHDWDAVVRWAIERNLAGIESLSIVPGTAGAAPVQNVGCYGQEVSETIISLKAYDMEDKSEVVMTNTECGFGYRDSIFKKPEGKRFIITEVSFRLLTGDQAPVPEYVTLQEELERRKITGRPSLQQIRDAVITVRHGRLPDPAKIPTAGSFFHNPIVSAEQYQALAVKHPDLVHFPVDDGRVKLSAPWLIEDCGLKGYQKDGIGIYERQAVAVINPGHRPAKDILAFRDFVARKVRDRFGVELTMEPELVTD